jgi:hypothetical protein
MVVQGQPSKPNPRSLTPPAFAGCQTRFLATSGNPAPSLAGPGGPGHAYERGLWYRRIRSGLSLRGRA